MKERLSDYVRYQSRGSGFTLRMRAGTGRGDRFGDAGSVSLDDEEARELYEILDERYGEK
jgi:hypothetical protein